MNIEKLIREIIPPADYQHRNGFNNLPLIDKLTANEKELVENELITKLLYQTDKEIDTLIVETLTYLKSVKSLPVLKDLLKNSNDGIVKLIIAASIFEISQESEMIGIAIDAFKKLENNKNSYYVHSLSSAFYYLAKFKNARVNAIIQEYTNHKEYLISYNAKRVLGIL